VSFAEGNPESDVGPAAWVVAGVAPFRANLVTSLVPRGFPAYARVFHPAGAADGAAVRWAAVARANERIAHPAMEWVGVTGDWRFLNNEAQPGIWARAPEEGSLPPNEAGVLAGLLAPFTAAERWWFALWEGFGSLPTRWQSAPRVPLPDRHMYLFAGTPADVTASFNRPGLWPQSANLWWPDDRAWCVATDIDLMSTYVGGSRATIGAVLGCSELESAEVPPDQTLGFATETVNPVPARPW
jgi:hypothetical protein